MIILPYNVFVVGVFMSSGADLAGPSQTIAGLLLGIVNQQISAQVYNQAWFAGFKKKAPGDSGDRVDYRHVPDMVCVMAGYNHLVYDISYGIWV